MVPVEIRVIARPGCAVRLHRHVVRRRRLGDQARRHLRAVAGDPIEVGKVDGGGIVARPVVVLVAAGTTRGSHVGPDEADRVRRQVGVADPLEIESERGVHLVHQVGPDAAASPTPARSARCSACARPCRSSRTRPPRSSAPLRGPRSPASPAGRSPRRTRSRSTTPRARAPDPPARPPPRVPRPPPTRCRRPRCGLAGRVGSGQRTALTMPQMVVVGAQRDVRLLRRIRHRRRQIADDVVAGPPLAAHPRVDRHLDGNLEAGHVGVPGVELPLRLLEGPVRHPLEQRLDHPRRSR